MPPSTTSLSLPSFFLILRPPPGSTLLPYTTLFRSESGVHAGPALDLVVATVAGRRAAGVLAADADDAQARSEEHTSELQSHSDLVCRLLLEKKKALR